MNYNLRPNLIIAGAQKSGSTTLASRLAAHPQIYLPPQKELNFFTKTNWFLEIDSYLNFFSPGETAAYRMDATPGYLWTRRKNNDFVMPGQVFPPPLPDSMRSLLGSDIKILIILRHPIFRAISAFFHHFRMGRINTKDRIRHLYNKFGIIDIGFYSDHIHNYLQIFAASQVKVFFLEEYSLDKWKYDKEIFHWLGLNEEVGAFQHGNDNSNFKIEFSENVLRLKDGKDQVLHLKRVDPRFKKMLAVEPPVVEYEDMLFLRNVYKVEINKMYSMYPNTVSIWPENPSLFDYVR